MTNSFFTNIFLELLVSYWYFTIAVLLLKLLLVRFVTTDSFMKAMLVWISGTIGFIAIASLCGILFASAGVMIVPVLMLIFAIVGETLLCVSAFKLNLKRVFISVAICNTLLFFLLFNQFILA